MKRTAIVVGLVASAFAASLAGAQAQTYGGAPACAKDYKSFWESIDRSKFAKMSAEQIADLSRTGLRGYDGCTAGDERFMAENFFKKLDKTAPNAKASDIFKSGAFDAPGVKK
jgi:hypothetical protein